MIGYRAGNEGITMKTAKGTTVISKGQLIDGAGAPPVPPEARHIDARSGSILPGLVEAHFHATYFNVSALEDLDIKYPVEYVTLLAAANARLALECGYTAARSGGSL